MSSIVIPICFICLALVFIWMLAESRSHWIVKFLTAIIAVTLGIQMWYSLESYRGFDRAATLAQMNNKRAYCYWGRVDEPTDQSPGAVVLWMRMEDELSPSHFILENTTVSPQVYSFPYDRDFHQAVFELDKQITQNDDEPIEIVFNFNKDNNTKPPGHPGKEKPEGKWNFYQLPPPKLSPKVTLQ